MTDAELAGLAAVEKPDLDAVFFVGKSSDKAKLAKAKAEIKKVPARGASHPQLPVSELGSFV